MKNVNELQKEILQLITQSEPPLFAVFDFDNTCIVNDITEAVFHYMVRNDLFKDRTLLGNTPSQTYAKDVFNNYYELIEKGHVKEAYTFISKILSGFEVSEISSLTDKVIQFEGGNIATEVTFGRKIHRGIALRESTIDLMHFLQKHGVEIWIVSASIELLVKEVMKHFAIDAKIVGIKNVIIDDIITVEFEEPLSMFEGKVACIKKYINPQTKPLLVAGDSMNDLPMLEYAQLKVVVDRQNELTEKAKENNWWLID